MTLIFSNCYKIQAPLSAIKKGSSIEYPFLLLIKLTHPLKNNIFFISEKSENKVQQYN